MLKEILAWCHHFKSKPWLNAFSIQLPPKGEGDIMCAFEELVFSVKECKIHNQVWLHLQSTGPYNATQMEEC
jgi:hypothetical protein